MSGHPPSRTTVDRLYFFLPNRSVKQLSVFLTPLSREEILFLKSQTSVPLQETVTEVMRRKLLRRTRRQKEHLSIKDLENIERRAASAYDELKEAHTFQHVIPQS